MYKFKIAEKISTIIKAKGHTLEQAECITNVQKSYIEEILAGDIQNYSAFFLECVLIRLTEEK